MLYRNLEDRNAIEAQCPWSERDVAPTLWAQLARTADRVPDHAAVSFQLTSGPRDPAETLTWAELRDRTAQAANLFRSLGIGESDVVAVVMPNATETVTAILGGAVAGIVAPVNPLLEAEQIAAILRETGAKVVVTLRAFPKTDIARKMAEAVRNAPRVHTVLEVDLARYLPVPKRWLVPLIRPKNPGRHRADIRDFAAACTAQPTTLTFADSAGDRLAACFHTGGTTGMPKVAQHSYGGMLYNGWLGATLIFSEEDCVMCPLPMFHVFACHVVLMAMICSGGHMVLPTPAGYRGEGVIDNFWKLCARWRASFIMTVPTAVSALMQRPVDADISRIKTAFSGSAPMPLELFRRFESTCGVTVCEGYGLTEATCLIACNPVDGVKKVGSVGIPFPYTDVQIVREVDGRPEICGVDEVGEICVANPGVRAGQTYRDTGRNADLVRFGTHLRTGDLGRLDADGYLWITGRAKDLIIRGGHNIDPAEIEEALLVHPAVAFAGAIGQPDAHSGELPCAYVELVAGAEATVADLLQHARVHVNQRAAVPKHLTILPELPKTAVGKIFKPALRQHAIARVYDAALEEAGLAARVVEVADDKSRGLVARVAANGASESEIEGVLGRYVRPWEIAADSAAQ